MPAGSGLSVLLTARSAFAAPGLTVVRLVAELLARFRSDELLETSAMLVMTAPSRVFAFTSKTSVNADAVPASKLRLVQMIVPDSPMDGVEQVHPAGAMID